MHPAKSALLLFTLLSQPALADIQFDDISASSGVDQHRHETWGAAVADYDGDGLPDIYVNNHVEQSVLLHNNGDGTFSDSSQFADATDAWATQFNKRVDEHAGAWGDFDNDGDPDLMTANGFAQPFFENRDGKLYQIPNKITGMGWATHNIWLDNDNDGDLDVFFTAALENRAPRYYRNNDGIFTLDSDYVATTGIDCQMQMAAISDLNVDGQIDLTCGTQNGNWSEDGSFYSLASPLATPQSGLPVSKPVRDIAIADFNGDLRPDLFNVRGSLRPSDGVQDGPNRIEAHINAQASTVKTLKLAGTGVLDIEIDWNIGDFRCGGFARTTKVGAGSTIVVPGDKFDKTVLTLDAANPDYHGLPPEETCTLALGYFPAEQRWHLRVGPGGSNHVYVRASSTSTLTFDEITNQGLMETPVFPKYFLNQSAGFEDRSLNSGLAQEKCVSVVAADLDNDMDVDLYLACRGGAFNAPNVLYENDGNGNFTRHADAGGALGSVGPSFGSNGLGAGNSDSVVSADFNLDGFIDLFVVNGLNLRPHDGGGTYDLFQNKGNSNHWLQFDLRGLNSNRDGIGAKVFITTPDGTVQLREQNGGYHRWSQNHMRVHVGLGTNTQAQVRVEWPLGQVDTYDNVAADGIYRLIEGGIRETVEPPAVQPLPCGKPVVSNGVYLWQNCFSRIWTLESRGQSIDGLLTTAGAAITLTSASDLEADDSAALASATTLQFAFTATSGDKDSIDFTLDRNASACLELTSASVPLTVGANGFSVDHGLDLATMRSCSTLAPSSRIDIAVDDVFTLYRNGDAILQGTQWNQAQAIEMDLNPGDVLAVEAVNTGGPGSLIANVRLDGADLPSNSNWKVSTTAPLGWQFQSYDDSSWAPAQVLGPYGTTAPWNTNVAGWPQGLAAQWIWGPADTLFFRYQIPGADSDGDGIADHLDAFPKDPTESSDRDGDGVGDNADVFPDDPTETVDSDGDGQGDNSDPFPFDPDNGGTGGTPIISDACGEPNWSRTADRALLLWQDCQSNGWQLRLSGGGTSRLVATGYLSGPADFNTVTPFSLEGNDVLDGTTSGRLEYALTVFGTGVDGFDLSPPAGSCFKATGPNDLQVYVGANREPLTTSLSLDNLTECASEIDSDGDGLTDDEESLLGTDPFIADSDSGGVADGDEVAQGTDPLDASDDAFDSDGDGLADARESALGTDPALPDTDGDRLLDGEEVDVYGTDPLRGNTDSDGLSDWAEAKVFGTDPTVADTDGDTLNDGQERKELGTNPLEPDTDSGGVDDGIEVTRGTDPLDASDD